MSLAPRRIAANTTFYISALTIQKVLSFIYFSYLARSLGAELTGKYFFALSVTVIVTAVVDIGFTPVLTREVSKDKEQAGSILSQIFTIKLLLAALVSVAMLIIVPFAIEEVLVRHLLYIGLAIALLDSFALTFFATIRAHQNLLYESIASALFQVIVIATGGYAVYQGYDIRTIIMALFIASLFNMVFAIIVLRRKLGVAIRLQYNKELVKKLVAYTIPFAMAAIFIKIYAYIDTVFLKFLVDDVAVGVYSVAYKITFAFQFIPLAFVAALYPAFSYYWKHDHDALKTSFLKGVEYLLIIALPVAFGIAALAFDLIPLIYTSEFQASILPLIVLMLSLPFLFINFPVGSLLNACHRQTRQMIHLGITMVLNVTLNLVLIPLYGPLGAAIASTLSTIFIFALGVYVAYRIINVHLVKLMAMLVKLFAIALVMAVLVIVLKQHIPWYVAIVPGALLYIGSLYVFRIVSFREVLRLRSLFTR